MERIASLVLTTVAVATAVLGLTLGLVPQGDCGSPFVSGDLSDFGEVACQGTVEQRGWAVGFVLAGFTLGLGAAQLRPNPPLTQHDEDDPGVPVF